jgi:glutathione S-transferase
LARKFGLAGKGELEQAEVEMYADQVTDLLNAYAKARFEPDDARKAEFLKKLTEETVPAQLAIFEKRLASTGTGSIAVSGLTYADFYLALIYESVADAGVDAAERDAALAKYPNLKKLIQNVNTHPKIAAWIAKRPVTHM